MGEVQRPGLVEANPKYRRRPLARSLLFEFCDTRALRIIFTIYTRIHHKSLYHYTVRIESRGKVKEDDSGTNQKERKENNTSEIVITKVNLNLLSRVKRGET